MSENVFVPDKEPAPEPFALATVTSVTGGLFLKIDGEATARQKPFKRLASYSTPAVNDRVVLAKINGVFMVFGKEI